MSLGDEMRGSNFGDARLSKRLVALVDQLAAMPEQSFPAGAGGDAALEATYRFLGNSDVTPERILEPHLKATAIRASEVIGAPLVIHDTTEFHFTGDRLGLGWLDSLRKGFFGHFALCVANDGSRRPLGVLGLKTHFRYAPPKVRAGRRRRRFSESSEERRWWALVEEVENRIGDQTDPVHVMDREADSYMLLARMAERSFRFVIRMAFDRRIIDRDVTKVGEVLERAPLLVLREVPLAARPHSRHRSHPVRDTRVAKLAIHAASMTFARPDWASKDAPRSLSVNVVHVFETDPPAGCTPVDWRLVTTESISTVDDVATIVDIYRTRWVIEEYFRAIKSGCSLEKRQLDSKHAILNALAVFVPIAWQLLVLRSASRDSSGQPAAQFLSRIQLRVLQRHPSLKLGPRPSIREAMLAIAQLGGHIKNNGEPGWIVLGRGYEKLLLLEQGASLSQEM